MTHLRLFACVLVLLALHTESTSAQIAMRSNEPVAGTLFGLDPEALPVMTAGSPLWGDDVRIHTGAVSYNALSDRPVAVVADTLGHIYAAVNAVIYDTSSCVRVYRSTTGGRTWSLFKTFLSSTGNPIHAYDMCIADTLNGGFVLAFAISVTYSNSRYQGGTLYWASMLTDGTHLVTKPIEVADDAHVYSSPRICTNAVVATPAKTIFYVSAIRTPSGGTIGPMYVTHTLDWGASWADPDTSITGIRIEAPAMALDCASSPDSLILAYAEQGRSTDHLTIARNSHMVTGSWTKTSLPDGVTTGSPALAIDPTRGNAILVYARNRKSILFLSSNDQFRTYALDSIETGSRSGGHASVSWAPWQDGYYWRVAYTSTADSGEIYYKTARNTQSGFYEQTPTGLNQFPPTTWITPVIAVMRSVSDGEYRGICAYVGKDYMNVYFDALDLTSDAPEVGDVPETISLEQNFPNPFNPTTSMRYSVGVVGREGVVAARVRLAVYDLLGREVAVLVDEQKQPGEYTATWDAAGMPSGVYFYRLDAGGARETKKMLLLR